jgi:hypothetical protein
MVPVCKRCLLEGISVTEYEKTVQDYLDSLPGELKVDSQTLQNRLTQCDKCECLMNGICRVCGCFAIARAAKKISRCPAVVPKW